MQLIRLLPAPIATKLCSPCDHHTLHAGLTAATRTLSGWGRPNTVKAQVVQPRSVEQL